MYESVATVSYYAHFTTQGIDMGRAVHMDRGGGSHGQGREMQSTTLQKLCYEALVETMCMSLLLLFLIMHSSLHRVLIWEGGSHGQGRGFTWIGEGDEVNNLTEAVL